jgi:hypothetical protein
MPKNAVLACFWGILDNHFFLNGKLLGFETPNSMNYWVWYLENRNHLVEHFALFRLYEVEHFRAFPVLSSHQQNSGFRKL